ncbi:molybdenum cofactor sulfurase-like [Styela clava]
MEEFSSKIESLRETEFSRLVDQVYLDHAGSALHGSSQIESYAHALENNLLGNTHSKSSSSELMGDIISHVRNKVLESFNVTDDEFDVIFTSGATEALKLVGEYFDWGPGSTFIYLEDNHTSVVGIRELAAMKNASSYCLSPVMKDSNCNIYDLSQYDCKLVKSVQTEGDQVCQDSSSCLFAFPAMSNFSGVKYPLTWIKDFQNDNLSMNLKLSSSDSRWYVLCDCAAFCSTSPFDLKQNPADFITISFYKIFGFPTGLGALLIKKSSTNVLCHKRYFGGGSVAGWLASDDFFLPKPDVHEKMEDGSSNFLGILALKHGFDFFYRLGLDGKSIQMYTFTLWQKLHNDMIQLKHWNESPVVKIYRYRDSGRTDSSKQGPILAFNVMRSDGSFVGFNHVMQLANNCKIHLRGGCCCNLGACSSMLGISCEVMLKAYQDGHVCGDKIDLIRGQPIGIVRISLGYCSTQKDIEKFIEFLSENFVEKSVDNLRSDLNNLSLSSKNGTIILEKIVVYPIKSCQGMEVNSWEICETGLLYDRMWMIVDENNATVTLKKNSKLVLIYPYIDVENSNPILVLEANGFDRIQVPIILENPSRTLHPNPCCETKVCGDKVEGFDCGNDVSDWLTKVLGKRHRLLQKDFAKPRLTKSAQEIKNGAPQISLVNWAQYLLLNRSSIEYLYNKTEIETNNSQDQSKLIDSFMKRFRGNFIISGADPLAEDTWNDIVVHSESRDIRFTNGDHCNRCGLICVDPENGIKHGNPLKVLAQLKTPDNTRRKATLGVYFQHELALSSSTTISTNCKISVFKAVS